MYLYRKEFELLSDHKPLQFIFSPRSKPCARVKRWISAYISRICLSILLYKSDGKAIQEETEQYLCLISQNSDLEQVRMCLVNGNWNNLSCKEFLPVRDELCNIGHLVLRGTRIVISETLTEKILKIGHEGYPGIVWMKKRLR